MSNEEEKIANENLKKIRPQSPCKRFKRIKLTFKQTKKRGYYEN